MRARRFSERRARACDTAARSVDPVTKCYNTHTQTVTLLSTPTPPVEFWDTDTTDRQYHYMGEELGNYVHQNLGEELGNYVHQNYVKT